MADEDGDGSEKSIDVLATFFVGDGDHAPSNDGTGERCSEKVDVLVEYQ